MTVMRDVAIAKTKQMGEKSITKLQSFQEDEVVLSIAAFCFFSCFWKVFLLGAHLILIFIRFSSPLHRIPRF